MLYYINDLNGVIKSRISLNYKFETNVSISLKKFSLKSNTIYLLENGVVDLIYSKSGVCESSNFTEILTKLKYSQQKSLNLNVCF